MHAAKSPDTTMVPDAGPKTSRTAPVLTQNRPEDLQFGRQKRAVTVPTRSSDTVDQLKQAMIAME